METYLTFLAIITIVLVYLVRLHFKIMKELDKDWESLYGKKKLF